ncbi:hypothetical protein ECDEC14D_0194 [Escherichia coli DEC14D]|nr:hypothetical protein ECDEC10E_0311 [Escherichia coli DEC10E]EHX87303.1 hypothetical protein ECDEC14B_0287 [Escherichia coli DEC14B]EHX94358.1 hypothetical protein ECDEC14C_0287 [Escherichia coli DEC14C]EHX97762.1 hypothetical protein ECDEC14D_0194 [Escherichia coli DEC14D]KEO04798.1 hypothetical protein AB37_4642 [Escherichia coli 8-415-05_S1_C2]
MLLHKIIQPVADADVLNGFMRTNITTGGLIHLPFSDFDNIA